jgi:hypothetical protein
MASGGFRTHSAHENAHRKTLYADQMHRHKTRIREFAEACKKRAVKKAEATPFFVISFGKQANVVYHVNLKRALKIANRMGGTIVATLEAAKATKEIAEQWKKDVRTWKYTNGYSMV